LVGACDTLKEHRAEMFESLDIIINFISKYQKTGNDQQASLFPEDKLSIKNPDLLEAEKWNKDQCLKAEKELLGFYLSENPISKYEKELTELTRKETTAKDMIAAGGIINDIQYRFDKNNNKWALISFNTLKTNLQLYLFHDNFSKYENLIVEDQKCFILGKDFSQNENNQLSRLIVHKIYALDNQILDKLTKQINIRIDYAIQNEEILETINKLSEKHPGKYSTILHLISNKGKDHKVLSNKLVFNIEPRTLKNLRDIIGDNNVWLTI